jgi:uncharacterized phage protein (TIGR02218 family)
VTFASLETSAYSAIPVSLFRFNRSGQFWYYTDADRTIAYAGNDYLPIAISDKGVTISVEASDDALVVVMPATLPPCGLYVGSAPSAPVNLVVFRGQYGDPEVQVAWAGTVTTVKRTDPGTAELTCNTLSYALQAPGIRLGWQRACPYTLYDPHTCRADPSLWATIGTVYAVTGNTIVASAWAGHPQSYFQGGFLSFIADPVTGALEQRQIMDSLPSGLITLLGQADQITVGTEVTAYRGCYHHTDACTSFNNLANYGGFPMIPGVSPFSGDAVY